MKRREFIYGVGAAGALFTGNTISGKRMPVDLSDCGCDASPMGQQDKLAYQIPTTPKTPWQEGKFDQVLSKVRITNMKVVPVSVTPTSDRPYVFVKLETNVGVVGWGEATLEGKAGAAMAAVNDLKDSVIGSDPMQVEHHWQSMWVHAFFRGGPNPGIGYFRHRPCYVGPQRQVTWVTGLQTSWRTNGSGWCQRLLSCKSE